MKYIRFSASEDKAINEFLLKYGDTIPSNGVRMIDRYVSILYYDDKPTQIRKKVVIDTILTGITNFYINLAQEMTKELYYRKVAQDGKKAEGKAGAEMVVASCAAQEELKKQIKFSKEILTKIENNEITFD
jgi:hypothetical protein